MNEDCLKKLSGIILDLEYAAYNLLDGKKDTDLPEGVVESTSAETSLLIAIRDLKLLEKTSKSTGKRVEGPYFVQPTYKIVRYRQYDETNHPVNISLCQGLVEFQEAYYPDNFGIPALRFQGCYIRWIFPDEEERQKEIDRIINLFNG